MRNVSLRSAIRWAYSLKDFQISAPGWMESERYDIVAKAPATVSNEQVPAHAAGAAHRALQDGAASRDQGSPVYALMVGRKGTKLEPAKTPAKPVCDPPTAPWNSAACPCLNSPSAYPRGPSAWSARWWTAPDSKAPLTSP